MIRFNVLAAAVLMTAAAADIALGDDLPPEIKVPEVSVADAHGLYVRGDVGYSMSTNVHGGRVRSYDSGTGDYDTSKFDSSRFGGNNFTGGLGVGYQFNDLIRADLTGDLFRGDFSGKYAGSASDKVSASFKAGSLMANTYVDLGTVAGFTPYVGAGLGTTRVSWDKVSGETASYPGSSDWRFTYALMAGVAYQVAPNIKLDLGYRYSRVAGGDMFGYSAADTAAGANGTMGRDGALVRQEIRVGLRVSTW